MQRFAVNVKVPTILAKAYEYFTGKQIPVSGLSAGLLKSSPGRNPITGEYEGEQDVAGFIEFDLAGFNAGTGSVKATYGVTNYTSLIDSLSSETFSVNFQKGSIGGGLIVDLNQPLYNGFEIGVGTGFTAGYVPQTAVKAFSLKHGFIGDP